MLRKGTVGNHRSGGPSSMIGRYSLEKMALLSNFWMKNSDMTASTFLGIKKERCIIEKGMESTIQVVRILLAHSGHTIMGQSSLKKVLIKEEF